MDPDVCRNCGHSGKHIDFRDARCAITERDDAERDKLQADAALERARQLCDTSLALMKRQMQEFEDVNAAIDTLERALAAAEDRRERVRRDCGTHADVCRTARSNLQAAEEMAISAAGRYFQAGRAVTALEEREQLRASAARVDEAPAAIPMEEDDEEEGGTNDDGGEGEAAREAEDKKWQRSNERFCKWLRQSEAQRQILKSSWTKMRVAERLALAGEDVVDNHGDDNDDDDEEVARRKRVQEWAAARRLTDQLPPEEDPTMETEYLDGDGAASATGGSLTGKDGPHASRTGIKDESKDRKGSESGSGSGGDSNTDDTADPGEGTRTTHRAEGREPDALGADETDDGDDGGDEDQEGACDDAETSSGDEDGWDRYCCELRWRRRAAGGKDSGADREDAGARPGHRDGTGGGGGGGDGGNDSRAAAESYETEISQGAAVSAAECATEVEVRKLFVMCWEWLVEVYIYTCLLMAGGRRSVMRRASLPVHTYPD
ncbi:UbiD family decarboxylase [Colletotrichum higginsianum IMI 349063]|uniref:UbiD family decarboxylase n=1 Tax=Colletotrichum higginsianum (strain IMI 349063) TaxID=759273 RepID=A0A1B7YBC7_COLHI|nr:UbiD family decarboxylase [Colletotrichum higginsianum IMI 349063]OBR09198.1 UbiD family decarboxylase [Colletotrichum higginsianum IMI 349063]